MFLPGTLVLVVLTLVLVALGGAFVLGSAMGQHRIRFECEQRALAEARLRELSEKHRKRLATIVRTNAKFRSQSIRRLIQDPTRKGEIEAFLYALLEDSGRSLALLESLDARFDGGHTRNVHRLPDVMDQAIEAHARSGGVLFAKSVIPDVLISGPALPHLLQSIGALLEDVRDRAPHRGPVMLEAEHRHNQVHLAITADTLRPAAPNCRIDTATNWMETFGNTLTPTPNGWTLALAAEAADPNALWRHHRPVETGIHLSS